VQNFLLSGLRKTVEKTADEFDPALLTGLDATRAVEQWAAIEKVACAQKLRSAARAEEAGMDAETIVAESSGITQGAAKQQTRAARKAKGKTKVAFEKGKLSATQAKAIAEAVEANPDAEDSLLDLAEAGSTGELLSACDQVRHDAMHADGSLAARQRQARCLRTWRDGMGMTRLAGAFEPLVGAKIVAELERRSDRLFREHSRAKATIDTVEQRMADALAEVIEKGSITPNGKKRGPRTVVRLIATKAAVERGYALPGEKCETAEGQPIPMTALDDALLDPDTLVQEIDVSTIKTFKKYIPKRIRDILEANGVCCVVPTCRRTKNLQIDHTVERRDGGPTTLKNLGWLCPYHHRLKSSRLYELWRDTQGEWLWEPAQARAPAKPGA
jgi:hypothetical protein